MKLKAPSHLRMDLIGLTVLGIVCLKFTWGLGQRLDFALYDETIYLVAGRRLMVYGLPSPQWAPLYDVWYFVLSLFTPDNLQLYVLNYTALIFFTTLLLYVFLRRLGVDPFFSLLSSFLYIVSEGVQTLPYVTLFALLVLLVFFISATFARHRTTFHGIVWLGFLTVCYVRPEFILCFAGYSLYIMYLALCYFFRPHSRRDMIRWFDIIGFGVIALLLCVRFGFSLFSKSERVWMAFGQHYAWNFVLRNHLDRDWWLEWRQIIYSSFGNVHSVLAAARSNTAAFLMHLVDNARHYLPASGRTYLIAFYPASFLVWRCLQWIEIVTIAVGGVWLVSRPNKLRVIMTQAKVKLFLPIAGIVTLQAIFVSILIFPRFHYLIVQNMVLAAIYFYALSEFTKELRCGKKARVLGVVVVIGLCVIIPRSSSVAQNRMPVMANRSIVEQVRALGIERPVRVLEAEGGYAVYFGSNYRQFTEYDKKESFLNFINHKGINMVLVGPALCTRKRLSDDPEFKAFLSDPKRHGFIRFDLKGTDKYLLIKSSLLEK